MRKVFHHVANLSDLVAGSGLRVEVAGESLVVFLTEQGGVHASTPLCPHQNEPLDLGRLEGCEVICRRHHLRFDLQSGDCTNAGGYWLRTYEARLDGDRVLVATWEFDEEPRRGSP